MTQLNLTGGARIGMSSSTWPFAKLKVTNERLEISTPLIGNLVFRPEDIISIESYYLMPFIGQGIKINHRIAKYKDKVIFWSYENPSEIIRQIKKIGFWDNISSEITLQETQIIAESQKYSGFPFKTSFAIVVVVLLNVLFIVDYFKYTAGDKNGIPFGEGAFTAFGLVLLISLLIHKSHRFRKLAYKEGREHKKIERFLLFSMLVFWILFLILIIVFTIQ